MRVMVGGPEKPIRILRGMEAMEFLKARGTTMATRSMAATGVMKVMGVMGNTMGTWLPISGGAFSSASP